VAEATPIPEHNQGNQTSLPGSAALSHTTKDSGTWPTDDQRSISADQSHSATTARQSERRQTRRHARDAQLRLHVLSGPKLDAVKIIPAHMHDISAGGAQIIVTDARDIPEVGQRLLLEMVAEEEEFSPPPLPSQVVWTNVSSGYRFGVRFVEDDEFETSDNVPKSTPTELDIARVRVDPQVALRFPTARAKRWQVLPFAATEKQVFIAAGDQELGAAQLAIEKTYRKQAVVQITDADDLKAAIDRVYAGADSLVSGAGLEAVQLNESDAVSLYEYLLAAAVMYGASDIHIDSFEEYVRVRMRVDGQVETLRDLSVNGGAALISRLKVMAGLDISERRAPQDGRLRHDTASGLRVDARVATLPTKHGERLTLRILGQNAGIISLSSLGMVQQQLIAFSQAIRQPHGMILLTGPTGSGKSTTLFAAIQQLMNESTLNVITIEDPIEYEIPGATQVEVDPAEKVTFSKALRSTLRHDPDVVMVGEIRDAETADIAVKAALTGHLVFSTLHTNDAAGAITRLIDMGVPPFLVAATLRMVVAQRLVRRLCTHCAKEESCDPLSAAALGRPDLAQHIIHAPQGCMYCGGRGYTGRLALFEMITCDQDLSQLITNNASESELKAYLHQDGQETLAEDAAEKVRGGLTSMEEVLRAVISFSEISTEKHHNDDR
jgi:type II secretory ATPase GspE/PulE/Tfp pilus assembly ATPase PilB-like protein